MSNSIASLSSVEGVNLRVLAHIDARIGKKSYFAADAGLTVVLGRIGDVRCTEVFNGTGIEALFASGRWIGFRILERQAQEPGVGEWQADIDADLVALAIAGKKRSQRHWRRIQDREMS